MSMMSYIDTVIVLPMSMMSYINQTNDHLSPQFIKHKKNATAYNIGNLGNGMEQAQHVTELNR
jgi:hypothetical protein